MNTAVFRVVVDAKRPAMPWGAYATQEEAETAARKLRALGMHARVEGSDLTEGSDLSEGTP